MELSILSDSDFEAFASGHPQNNFIQSAPFTRFQRSRGLNVELVGISRNGELVAAAKLAYSRNRLGYTVCDCSKGPLVDYTDAALVSDVVGLLKKHAAQRKAAELRISPNLPWVARDEDGAEHPEVLDNRPLAAQLEGLGFVHQGHAMNFVNVNWMFIKSLTGIKDAEELIMGTSYRTRKAIRKAEKNGVYLEQATLETLDDFYDALSTAGNEKGFVFRERDYYEKLLRTTSDEFTKLMMAKIDIPAYRKSITERRDAEAVALADLKREVEETGSKKKANRIKVVQDLVDSYERSLKDIERFPDSVGVVTVAAIHFVCYGDELTCVIGGTVQDYIYFNGATSLYWGMMLHALEKGYTRYNFYGTFGIQGQDQEGHGGYEFKKGFGGEVVQLMGDFVVPVRPLVFRANSLARAAVAAGRTIAAKLPLKRGA
ncbi:peptidoglycan bridge formation glycyltransferase FemA/FemB family protein [Pseudarthrobacter sp. J75]|uniref:peptidoglycan bridge formation glycyltransferase FemA/FemB family protein n=1 Tax=unclassified Pseudarthrobacter TaxID=2647000 RepID=UPI002E820B82|nr:MULTISPECIES: peptidoglycan bridge formation glycyltransferase FemA/FemB family protein [unclassified Pseudarthrobacter]MEE2523184.1 peptidoglycan bridge formation glycyltransferase FemA/FemB family protein [Pseudarthrobacter sp. J47]MEE2527439.1 peptidoglycan bridge formation glycyltransferase FemA/FemB family protein [Pseudarthrobacter sp. J75]